MGCDIHSYVERRQDGRWTQLGDIFPLDDFDRRWQKKDKGSSPFDWRNYGMFGFLADVRNYSMSPVIIEPRGVPDDLSPEVDEEWRHGGGHSASWLTVAELTAYDYDQTFEDRRVMRNGAGNALAEPGEGATVTLREFLGPTFFEQLDILAAQGPGEDVRVVFWFDS